MVSDAIERNRLSSTLSLFLNVIAAGRFNGRTGVRTLAVRTGKSWIRETVKICQRLFGGRRFVNERFRIAAMFPLFFRSSRFCFRHVRSRTVHRNICTEDVGDFAKGRERLDVAGRDKQNEETSRKVEFIFLATRGLVFRPRCKRRLVSRIISLLFSRNVQKVESVRGVNSRRLGWLRDGRSSLMRPLLN